VYLSALILTVIKLHLSYVPTSLSSGNPSSIRMIPWRNAPGGYSSTTSARADWLAGAQRGHSSVIVGAIPPRRLRDRWLAKRANPNSNTYYPNSSTTTITLNTQLSPLRSSTLLYAPLRSSTLLYASLRYAALRYATLLYSTLLYSTLLHSTLLYSTLLYSSLLYSTLLYLPISPPAAC
jgi:hypothetical protein